MGGGAHDVRARERVAKLRHGAHVRRKLRRERPRLAGVARPHAHLAKHAHAPHGIGVRPCLDPRPEDGEHGCIGAREHPDRERRDARRPARRDRCAVHERERHARVGVEARDERVMRVHARGGVPRKEGHELRADHAGARHVREHAAQPAVGGASIGRDAGRH
jgi:hypothetical protein